MAGLALTAVKGTSLQAVPEVSLSESGVRENRRFFLIDEGDEMVNALRLGELQRVVSRYSDQNRRLRLELPDGRILEDTVVLGSTVQTKFYSERLPASLVEGPWAAALSEVIGKPVRLVEAGEDGAVDRGTAGAVSLISRGSLKRLASEGDLDEIDSRRFRMLIEVDGLEAHAEDSWVGRSARIGQAMVRFEGHVGRCAITTRNPSTGVVDVATLKMLGRYRQDAETTEPVAFGIYGRVLEPGQVRVGDEVALAG
ncbi:MAG TPA: MOSC domain-containing protein [Solirubrobacteraceae bacterium]|nr:MOSC domain-containing protein [Solirubrobacteraceae bacterium]